MLERFNRLIDELVERVRAQPTYGWATVVSVSPLQIRYDGQADPVVGAPSRLVSGLAVGDRVWCQRIHRRDIILGKGQGDTVRYKQTVRETTDTITATSAAEFNITAQTPFTITCSEPTWHRIVFQAWKGGASSEMRAGIELAGATTQPFNSPAWGAVIRSAGSDGGSVSTEKVVLLNTGVTSVKVVGYKIGSNDPTISYQILSAYSL